MKRTVVKRPGPNGQPEMPTTRALRIRKMVPYVRHQDATIAGFRTLIIRMSWCLTRGLRSHRIQNNPDSRKTFFQRIFKINQGWY